MIWIGQQDCNCPGSYSISPKIMLAIDGFLVLPLLVCRQDEKTNYHHILSLSWAPLGVLAISLVLFFGLINLPLGFATSIKNHENVPVQIVGGLDSFSLSTIKNLPVTIGANQTKAIEIDITFSGTNGSQDRKFHLYSDYKYQPIIFGNVCYTITGKN